MMNIRRKNKIRLAFLLIMSLLYVFSVRAQCGSSGAPPTVLKTFGSGTPLFSQKTAADFGFATTYVQELGITTPQLTNDGEFSFVNRIHDPIWNVWHHRATDHTGDPDGYMMMVNANNVPGEFYRDNVSGLCTGVSYEFSVWITNLDLNEGRIKPNILFEIRDANDNSLIVDYNSGDIGVFSELTWERHSLTFTATTDEVILLLINNNPGGSGNDLALDDIAFTPCLPKYEITGKTDICEGYDLQLDVVAPSTPYTSPEYQWQRKNSAGVWNDIAGAQTTSLIKNNITLADSGWYRVLVADFGLLNSIQCRSVDSVLVQAIPLVTAGKIEAEQLICFDTSPLDLEEETAATGGDGNYKYSWESSSDGTTWNDRNSNSVGFTETIKYKKKVFYRRKVESACFTEYSDTIEISVLDSLQAGKISSNQTICYNTSPFTFNETSAVFGGGENYVYSWEYSTNGTSWNDKNSSTVEFTETEKLKETTFYRRKVVSDCSTSYSDTIQVTVRDSLKGGEIDRDQTICFATNASLLTEKTPVSGGGGSYVYSWESSTDGIIWNDRNTNSIQFTDDQELRKNTFYRRKVTALCSVAFSDTIKVLVYDSLIAGKITENQTICFGTNPISFTETVPASGGGGINSYFWESSTDGVLWIDRLSNSIDFSETNLLNQKTFYRRKVVAACSTTYSDTIEISVLDSLDGGKISADQIVCYEALPQKLNQVSASHGGSSNYTYEWEFSGDLSTWSVYPNSNSTEFQAPEIRRDLYVRRKTIDASCSIAFSDTIKLTFQRTPSPKTTPVTYCQYQTGLPLTATGTDVKWYNFDFDVTGSSIPPTINTYLAQTYKVYATQTIKTCESEKEALNITIYSKPILNVNSGKKCLEANFQLKTNIISANGTVTYSWTPVDNLTSNNTSNTIYNGLKEEIFTVIATDENSCSDTAIAKVELFLKPEIILQNEQICEFDSIEVIPQVNNANGSLKYTWSTSYDQIQNNEKIVFFPKNTTDYQLIITDQESCKDTASLTIVVNSKPILNLDSGKKCLEDTYILASSIEKANGLVKYSWTPTNNLSNSNEASTIYNGSVDETFTLIAIDDKMCSDTTKATVSLYPKPEIDLTDVKICEFDSIKIQPIITNATGIVSHNWSPSTDQIIKSNEITFFPKSTSMFTLIITDSASCKDTATINVTVHSKPELIVNSGEKCLEDSFDLTTNIVNSTGLVKYVWSPATGLTNTDQGDTKYIGNTTQSFNVVAIDANNCSDTAIAKVIVLPKPVVSLTDESICEFDSIEISPIISNTSGATIQTWLPATEQLMEGNKTTFFPKSTTEYTLIVTDSKNCSDTAKVIIIVNPKPDLTIESKEICKGESTTLTSNLTGTIGMKYKWKATSLLGSNDSLLVSPISNTNYTLEVEDEFTCKDTAHVLVTVFELPEITANDISYCEEVGGNISVDVKKSNGTIALKWPTSISNVLSTDKSAYVNSNKSTEYIIIGEDQKGCLDTITVKTTVFPKPKTTIEGGDICSGVPTNLNTVIENASGNYVYTWSPSIGLSATNTQQVDASPEITTEYQVIVEDKNQCLDTATHTVGVTETPISQIEGVNTILCPSESVVYAAYNDPSQNYHFQWYEKNGDDLQKIPITSSSASFNTTGTYLVMVDNEGFCERFSQEVQVKVEDIKVMLHAKHEEVYYDEPIELIAKGTPDVLTYSWSDPISDKSDNQVVFYSEEDGLYEVTAKGQKCTDIASVGIRVLPRIIIPNGFSPNGDSKNERWFIKGLAEYENAQVVIYNRWGSVVYRYDQGYEEPWEGVNSGGDDLPMATYYYVIHVNDRRNQVFNGSISIVR